MATTRRSPTSLIERFSVEMDRPLSQLSKGNKQKVGLLLAFMHRPDVLILDEPTAGLDPLVQAEFDLLLRETAAAGRTVLLSSHSLDDVQRVADRVAIIRDGRLVVTDTVRHLRANAVRVVTMQFDTRIDPASFTLDRRGQPRRVQRSRGTAAGVPVTSGRCWRRGSHSDWWT